MNPNGKLISQFPSLRKIKIPSLGGSVGKHNLLMVEEFINIFDFRNSSGFFVSRGQMVPDEIDPFQ
jgi:hypothetical protein